MKSGELILVANSWQFTNLCHELQLAYTKNLICGEIRVIRGKTTILQFQSPPFLFQSSHFY